MSHFNADGQSGKQLGESLVDGFTDVDNIDPGDIGDGNANGRLALESHLREGRLEVTLVDRADVTDLNQLGRTFNTKSDLGVLHAIGQ